MATTRRNLLKLGGLAGLGLVLLPVGTLLAGEAAGATGASAKGDRKQWAMLIDLNKCQASAGCRDCIGACHAAHNVPDIGDPLADSKEEVKWIWTETFAETFGDQADEYMADELKQKLLPVMCNHCTHPACVRVCPTEATYKRPDGIVAMDYHRCIGCRYCMAACPHGARSFNFRDPRPSIREVNPAFPTRERGVVEKCNFCAERVDVGMLPACVTACKYGALAFGDLTDTNSAIRKALREGYALRRKPDSGTDPNVYYRV
ncbi:MAG TPA: 4Fe-4S dicluster domain-containing protein [Symbiobacteriaceae bacterium]|jgi:molybdopterin-containing oxidoreductase family iron-sulfur binding subunit